MAITEKFTNKYAGEGVKKKEPSYTVGENVGWYSQKQYGSSLKN